MFDKILCFLGFHRWMNNVPWPSTNKIGMDLTRICEFCSKREVTEKNFREDAHCWKKEK